MKLFTIGVQPVQALKWERIFESDDLYREPISIMQELYRKDKLATHLIRLIEQVKLRG